MTVRVPTANAARTVAQRRGESLSMLTDRALRDYLIREAARAEPPTDPEWLDAVASTLEELGR